MKTIIVIVVALIPHLLFAGTDCRVKEYPDHYLAECTGDEKAWPAPLHSSVVVQPTLPSGSQSEGANGDRQPKPAAPAYSATTGGTAHNESSRVPEVQHSDHPSQPQAVLSKRNYAKIEAAQTKELKHKAQLETAQ